MARSHRLFLTQDDYLNYAIEQARNTEHLEFRLGTWGVSRVTAGSRIASLLVALHLSGKAEILVGLGDLGQASKVAGIVRQYTRIKWRFSSESHAKYFLWRRSKRNHNKWSSDWLGMLGSCNLSDSQIWNVGFRLPSAPATDLAHEHAVRFKEADDMITILKRMNTGLQSLMTGTIVQANDTGRNRTPAG